MPGTTRARHVSLFFLLAAALVVSASGCSISDDREGASEIPEAELREPGALSACTDPTRPPLEYRSTDGVLRGFEVDLVTELARRLGLEPRWVETPRSRISEALAGKECDVAASTLSVRRDAGGRLGEIGATAYLAVPLSLLVRPGDRMFAVTGLCGKKVGVFPASLEHDLLVELGASCPGDEPLEPVDVDSTPDVVEALRVGRISAILAEHPVNSWYARRQTDRFDLAAILGEEVVRWAIGTDAERVAVYDAIRVALRALHEDGTFRELVERWGLDRAGAVALPTT